MIELSPDLHEKFGGSFDAVMRLDGEIYRAKEGRRTLAFRHDGQEYFAKIHGGVGWKEIFKNLFSLKLPALDASREWQAVRLLEDCGVDTVEVVGKGVRGWNPARRESFVLMRALEERIEVEDFLKDPGGLTGVAATQLRRAIIRKVAETARKMHAAGMNHRDFYLCHFHLLERDWSGWVRGEEFRLPVLDLHRAQLRDRVPRRWLVKDLGALLYSLRDCEWTDRDLVAFLQIYLGREWKESLGREAGLWRAVVRKANGFQRRHGGGPLRLPGVFGGMHGRGWTSGPSGG